MSARQNLFISCRREFTSETESFGPTGIANEQKKLYGTQFHPEVDLTERGMEMLRNFLFEIAGCTSNFTVQNRQQTCITEIRDKVDKSKVLVSGKIPRCFISVQLGPLLRAWPLRGGQTGQSKGQLLFAGLHVCWGNH